MAKTDEFEKIPQQAQHDAVRAALLRVIEEEETGEAVLRALTPKLAHIHHRIDALEKKISALSAAMPARPTRPALPAEDPTYGALDWTHGITVAPAGPPVTANDFAIPEATQETWHTNPME